MPDFGLFGDEHVRQYEATGRRKRWLQCVVTPALHRRHHAASWRELDTYFGTVFSCGDRLAGTFLASEPHRAVRTGLPGELPSAALRGALWLPFGRPRAR